ncbi:MAG: hypothetical protein MR601_04640 [Erysipelotrichaceae bacterium]|nr:hypothetical protein [Erysipelotrichaceae bacterium]
MKKNILKITTIATLVVSSFFTDVKAVGFDEAAAKSLAESYITPFTSFLLWAVPLVCVVGCIGKYITWMGKDDDEKEQKPIAKSIKKYIFWAVVVESIAAIMKVFGL